MGVSFLLKYVSMDNTTCSRAIVSIEGVEEPENTPMYGVTHVVSASTNNVSGSNDKLTAATEHNTSQFNQLHGRQLTTTSAALRPNQTTPVYVSNSTKTPIATITYKRSRTVRRVGIDENNTTTLLRRSLSSSA